LDIAVLHHFKEIVWRNGSSDINLKPIRCVKKVIVEKCFSVFYQQPFKILLWNFYDVYLSFIVHLITMHTVDTVLSTTELLDFSATSDCSAILTCWKSWHCKLYKKLRCRWKPHDTFVQMQWWGRPNQRY